MVRTNNLLDAIKRGAEAGRRGEAILPVTPEEAEREIAKGAKIPKGAVVVGRRGEIIKPGEEKKIFRRGRGGGGGGGGISAPAPAPTFESSLLRQSFPSQAALRKAETSHKLQVAKTESIQKLTKAFEGTRPTTIQEQLVGRREFQTQKSAIEQAKTITKVPQITMPSFVERVRGKIRKVTGISIPGIAAVKEMTGVYAPKEIPRAAWEAAKKIPEQIPAGATLALEKVGVPEIIKEEEIEIPERRIFERGTGIIEPTKKVVVPEPKIMPGAPTYKREVTIISPEKIGRGLALGAYAVPVVGLGLLATEVGKGVEAFRKKVPTVSEVIKEQTSNLSTQERKEYLKTEEGKVYEKSVEGYVSSLERQRREGLGMAALAGVALAAPFAYRGVKRGIKYAKEPVFIYKAPRPKPLSYYEAVTIPTKAEEAVGIAAVGEVFPGRIGAIQPRWEKLLSRPTKLQFIEKPTSEVGILPFKVVGEGEAGVLVKQKVGPRTTMKTYDIITGRMTAVPKAIGEMPPLMQWITKKGLPPRALPEGVKVTAESGRIFRFGSVSEKQAKFFIPKTPVSLKDAPLQLGVTRAVRREVPGPIKIYDVESAIKSTTSLMPRRAGKVDYVAGRVMVLPPKPSPTAVGTVIAKKLTKTQLLKQKQLAEQVGGLVARAKFPRPKIPKTPKPTTIITPESYVLAPKIVGGLGKGVSRYYGKGTYEVTPLEVGRIEIVGMPVVAKVDVPMAKPVTIETPLISTKQKDRIEFVQLGLPRDKVKEEVITLGVTKEREESVVIPRFVSGTRARTAVIPKVIPREAVIPKLVTKVVQVQKPKTRFFFPGPRPRPKPRPKPRIPKTPVIIIPLTDKLPEEPWKKKKKDEELVTPFVKRFGKWFGIGKPITQKKALKKGVTRLRSTLAASLQLRRPSGEIIPFAKGTKEFRIGKAGPVTLVQRQRQRLARIGEVQEIIASRRAGAKKFI